MRERTVRVYRLLIAYPAGSDDPDWTPACWGEMLAAVKDRTERRSLRRRGFRWPRERMFLSASGAWSRAALLTMFGAQVTVQPSEPVTWWEDTDAAEWYPVDDEDWAGVPGMRGVPGLAGFEADRRAADEAAKFSAGDVYREHSEFWAKYFDGAR
jgi:hypothetical protein